LATGQAVGVRWRFETAHRVGGCCGGGIAAVPAYDRFYQRFISKVAIADVSASFAMEDIKDTTALPI